MSWNTIQPSCELVYKMISACLLYQPKQIFENLRRYYFSSFLVESVSDDFDLILDRWYFRWTSWRQWTRQQAEWTHLRSTYRWFLSTTTSSGLWGLWLMIAPWRAFRKLCSRMLHEGPLVLVVLCITYMEQCACFSTWYHFTLCCTFYSPGDIIKHCFCSFAFVWLNYCLFTK